MDIVVSAQGHFIRKNAWMRLLVLKGEFSHLAICWWNNTAGHKQLRQFLERTDVNFLTQVTHELFDI